MFVKMNFKDEDRCFGCYKKKIRVKREGTVISICNHKGCSFCIDVNNIEPWVRTDEPVSNDKLR